MCGDIKDDGATDLDDVACDRWFFLFMEDDI
jgi:hypothetical protein